MMKAPRLVPFLSAIICLLAAGVSFGQSAEEILEAAGTSGGLVVHVGCGDGRLTAELLAGDGYLVQGLDADPANVAEARRHVQSLGLYGRASIDAFDGRRLPYVDNLVNLLVAEDLGEVPMAEVMRVLCPGGVACVGEEGKPGKTICITKPWPHQIDEWTHWLHGADGNAVADDTRVGPPRHAQWVAPPRWQRHHNTVPSVNAMVSAGGRLFAFVDEAPAGIDGMPDRWFLLARDAFNGTLLWKRPIEDWGWDQWSDHSFDRFNQPTHIMRRLVAVGDRVYVTPGFNAPLSALDAATGRVVMTYPEGRFTDEVLYHEGKLVLAVNQAAQRPGRIAERPPVKKSVVALDAETGKLLWKAGDFAGAASKADAIERVTHLTMVIGSGKVFLVDEDAIVALDVETGERKWRLDRAPHEGPVSSFNYHFANLFTLVHHDGVVFFAEPDAKITRQAWNEPVKATLSGIAVETGEVLWTGECGVWGHYNEGDVFVIGGLAWVHDSREFKMLGLDPLTGEIKKSFSTQKALDQEHHHRCYRNKATTRYILTSRRGVEFLDVASDENLLHHWVRGTCRYGILPCNGLLYAPPHPCICYLTAKLNGFWALAPERGEEREARGEGPAAGGEGRGIRDERPRVERGPAFVQLPSPAGGRGAGDEGESPPSLAGKLGDNSGRPHPAAAPPPSPIGRGGDWPTYRHDAARSGRASTTVAAELETAWQTKLGGRLTSPVIAAGTVYVASPDAHTVWALAAADGKPRWSYTTGGRVDAPPTIHSFVVPPSGGREPPQGGTTNSLCLFGSADGFVYCLRADDGRLAWRLRAAPDDLRMVACDQLESPWPVHGSVLIEGGVAYFAAGRSSFLDGGIYVYAVDSASGEVLARRRIYSPDPATDEMITARLRYDMPAEAPGALPDVLVGDGRSVYMRHLEFNPANLDYRNVELTDAVSEKSPREQPALGAHLMAGGGLLDDSWFNQTYWTIDGKSHGKLLVFDDEAAYGVKPFAGSARHSRAIFTPATKGYALFATRRPEHKPRWSIQVPLRVRAMLVAGPTLFVAGPPDVVDPVDPWAAFDGKKGAMVWAVATADGRKLAEHQLESPPLFDGMAAAGGRLYLATTDGSVVCFRGE